MATIIYPSPIFGPVHSRRLGTSLGINLQPADGKVCTFDCIYCECGFNADRIPALRRPSREQVAEALENRLRRMKEDGERPDVLTFAGNGEPTGHPQFEEIIDDTVRLRDRYFPDARISVLSNSTFIHREGVRRALMKVDNNILKLDSALDATVRRMNNPQSPAYSVRDTVERMKRFGGRMILQTMFLRGSYEGRPVDNTTEREVSAWLELVKEIGPRQVMIYTIDRDTPDPDLEKVYLDELGDIARRVRALGIECSVAG